MVNNVAEIFAPSVTKAFEILGLVTKAPRGLKISDLSKELGIGKSTVHGITAALEGAGGHHARPGH